MPVAAVMQWVKNLLTDLEVPSGLQLVTHITPLDPDVEADVPKAYVWPLRPGAHEKRDPKDGGSMPRYSGPGTPAGDKTIRHRIGIWVVWFGSDEDPEADTLFPGIVDAIMAALRASMPNPATLTDPYTGEISLAADTGEEMWGDIEPPRSLENQRYLRYDGLITVPIQEVISA